MRSQTSSSRTAHAG